MSKKTNDKESMIGLTLTPHQKKKIAVIMGVSS